MLRVRRLTRLAGAGDDGRKRPRKLRLTLRCAPACCRCCTAGASDRAAGCCGAGLEAAACVSTPFDKHASCELVRVWTVLCTLKAALEQLERPAGLVRRIRQSILGRCTGFGTAHHTAPDHTGCLPRGMHMLRRSHHARPTAVPPSVASACGRRRLVVVAHGQLGKVAKGEAGPPARHAHVRGGGARRRVQRLVPPAGAGRASGQGLQQPCQPRHAERRRRAARRGSARCEHRMQPSRRLRAPGGLEPRTAAA